MFSDLESIRKINRGVTGRDDLAKPRFHVKLYFKSGKEHIVSFPDKEKRDEYFKKVLRHWV